MDEIKKPRKPLIFYYGITLLVLMLINFIVLPWLVQRQIIPTDYGSFLEMVDNKQVGEVQIQTNQILFTDKETGAIYKTGVMDHPNLVERLEESGAIFSKEIIEQMSPFLSFILTWVLPIVLFVAIGRYMSKKLMERATGGKSSMQFGKSNAKVYVSSSDGIKFDDVAGVDEAKENLLCTCTEDYNNSTYFWRLRLHYAGRRR